MLAASAALLLGAVGTYSRVPQTYFHEARHAYRSAGYAGGRGSVVRRYSREDPSGVDAMYDWPDPERRRIPDEVVVWGVKGLRNVRDIGGWTGIRTGMVYRGSQLYRTEGAPDGIDPETRRVVREEWRLATDFDLRGSREWGVRDYANTNLVEFQAMGVPKLAFRFPSYQALFDNPEVVRDALRALSRPETYPAYIHCAGGADRTGCLVFILEALCGVPEADIDVDYELTSFATVFGLRDRDEVLTISFRRFKDRFRAYPGETLAEQVENACLTTFMLTREEVASIRRILMTDVEWLYSLVDQRAEVAGRPGTWIDLAKGWTEVPRGTRVTAAKTVASITPPPFPNEPRRAYEFTRINRTKDDYPALLAMSSADGWKVECRDAEAEFRTTEARELFGGPVTRVDYRMTGPGTNTLVTLTPPEPVKIGRGFDATGLWMYGNLYPYDRADGACTLTVKARFRGARGESIEIPVAENWCAYWFLNRYQLSAAEAAAVADGGTFEGFSFGGFANTNSVLSLFFSNMSVFRDEKGRPDIPVRPKRAVKIFDDQDQGMNVGEGTLPFPTTPDTVVPPVAAVDRDLEFRFPARPDESWDDLAFRYKGGEWIAVSLGGGVLPRGAGKGGTFRFHRIGNSIVCDMLVKGGAVTDVVFGAIDYAKLPKARKVPVPYYNAPITFKMFPGIKKVFELRKRPGILVTEMDGRPFFIGETWDWTQSAGSFPYCEDDMAPFGGVAYYERTDCTRADCCERFVWSFAFDPVEALANIPNPVSPMKKIAGTRAFAFARSYDLPLVPDVNPQENETRERIWDYWRHVRRLGVRDLNLNGHEKMWRDYMDSFTFKTNAAPLKGGDAACLVHAERLRSLGYRVGPYNNFTDFAPVNENWNPDMVARMCSAQVPSTNQMYRAWTRTYLPKPVYSVHAMETLLPVVKEKFGFQCAYSDVHTAYAPWFRVDYDRRMPGAASMSGSFYAYGELMHRQKFIWNGPVYSEGWGHVVYAGLSDGDFARDDDYFSGVFSSRPDERWDMPWIVDYDLRRIHPLNCCVGTMARNFYGRHKPSDPDEYTDRYLAYLLAFGHATVFHNGFFMRDNSLIVDDRLELRLYYMSLAIAGRTTQAGAKEIRYGDGGGALLDTARAIATGAVGLNHIKVTYDDGSVVAVNGDRERPFSLDWRGRRITLGPNCSIARSGDGVKVYSGFVDGHRADLSVSPDYVYLDGRGKFVSFDEGGSDGMLIRLAYPAVVEKPLAAGEEDVILRNATVAELPYAAAKIVAMDEGGVAFREIAPEIRSGRTVLHPVDSAVSFRVTRRAPLWYNPSPGAPGGRAEP